MHAEGCECNRPNGNRIQTPNSASKYLAFQNCELFYMGTKSVCRTYFRTSSSLACPMRWNGLLLLLVLSPTSDVQCSDHRLGLSCCFVNNRHIQGRLWAPYRYSTAPCCAPVLDRQVLLSNLVHCTQGHRSAVPLKYCRTQLVRAGVRQDMKHFIA